MSDDDTCPHCGHLWDNHDGLLTGLERCDVCGCMWTQPKPPPPPPSGRDQLIATIADTIWTELERQSADGQGPYVDREMDMVDASGAGLDMNAVAAAVAAIFVDSEDDCSWCHSCTAIDGWKRPLTEDDPEAL